MNTCIKLTTDQCYPLKLWFQLQPNNRLNATWEGHSDQSNPTPPIKTPGVTDFKWHLRLAGEGLNVSASPVSLVFSRVGTSLTKLSVWPPCLSGCSFSCSKFPLQCSQELTLVSFSQDRHDSDCSRSWVCRCNGGRTATLLNGFTPKTTWVYP